MILPDKVYCPECGSENMYFIEPSRPVSPPSPIKHACFDCGHYNNINTSKQNHSHSVGDLVEIINHRDDGYNGMRMYITGCVRDCDGTPLYTLGARHWPLYASGTTSFYYSKAVCGISENAIKLIRKP